MKYKYRYVVAEEVLRQGGSNAEIQRRVMREFPDSALNLGRAAKYRRSWERYGHCRCREDKGARAPRKHSKEAAIKGILRDAGILPK